MDTFGSDKSLFDPDSVDDASVPYPMDEDYQLFRGPAADGAVSGTELRRRLITPEALAAIHAEEPKRSLLQRILKHK